MTTTRNELVVVLPQERTLVLGARQRDQARTRRVRGFWFRIDQVLNSMLVTAILAVCAAVPWLYTSSPPSAVPAAVRTSSKFVTAQVTRGDLSIRVSATGTVEPVRLVEVSTELSGSITAVHVDNNDLVKAGQLLAELDSDTLEKERARAEAQVAAVTARIKEARAEGTAAEKNLARKSMLARKRLTSERDLDTASASAQQSEASVEALRAELAGAEANLSIAEAMLKKARIVSPIDGIVLRRNIEPGQTVAASLQAPVLFRLAQDLDRMQIRVDVDEADALSVREGQTAMFSVQALREQQFEARVEKLFAGPEIVQGVVTYKAILSFDNASLNLKPGMTATAEIVVETVRGDLVVPNAALRFSPPDESSADSAGTGAALLGRLIGSAQDPSDRGTERREPEASGNGRLKRVFVEKDGGLVPILVEVGVSDGTVTQILSGELTEGQPVVVDIATAGA